MKQGMMKQGVMKQGMMKQGEMKQGEMKQGVMKQGVMKQCVMKQGVMKQGEMKQGVMNHAPTRAPMSLVKIHYHVQTTNSYDSCRKTRFHTMLIHDFGKNNGQDVVGHVPTEVIRVIC